MGFISSFLLYLTCWGMWVTFFSSTSFPNLTYSNQFNQSIHSPYLSPTGEDQSRASLALVGRQSTDSVCVP